MDEQEEPGSYRRSAWPMLMIAGVIVLCIALTIIVYVRSMDQTVSISDNGFSFTKVETDKTMLVEPTGHRWDGPGIQSNSSLKMVDPRSDDTIFLSVAPGTSPVQTASAAMPLPPKTQPLQADEPPALSPGEQKVMDNITGHWDSETAAKYASNPGLIPTIADKLLPYPRIMGILLNNQLLVKTFMNSSNVQWLCSDRKNMVSFLSDGQSRSGAGPWARILQNAGRYPGATDAIMTSAGASAFMRGCGPVMQVATDQQSMVTVMTKNPELMKVLPTFMQGLSKNPDAQKLYQDVSKIQGALANVQAQQ